MDSDDVKDFYTRPKESTCDVVIKIWKDLLNAPNVGPSDNFLLLGGESLLATQASARLRDIYGLEVSLRSILVATVKEIADEISLALQRERKTSI